MASMIKLRHQQPSLWHSGLAADIEDLWEPWMRLVDGLLEDEQLLDTWKPISTIRPTAVCWGTVRGC
jgi:hypothetical protein